MPSEIEILLEKNKLDELVYRTMHALDRCDWPAYRESFVEEVEFDFREHKAAPSETNELIVGIDNVIALQRSVLEGFDAIQHQVTNLLHRIEGDMAWTDCYLYAEHFLNNNDCGDRSVSLGGRYEITWRRIEREWKASKWRFTSPWLRGNPMIYQLAAAAVVRRDEGKA